MISNTLTPTAMSRLARDSRSNRFKRCQTRVKRCRGWLRVARLHSSLCLSTILAHAEAHWTRHDTTRARHDSTGRGSTARVCQPGHSTSRRSRAERSQPAPGIETPNHRNVRAWKRNVGNATRRSRAPNSP